jgi:hypothetical protein
MKRRTSIFTATCLVALVGGCGREDHGRTDAQDTRLGTAAASLTGTSLISPLPGGGRYGNSVSISSSGNTALVGAPDSSVADYLTGAGVVFARVGGSWVQEAELFPSNPVQLMYVGATVAVSDEVAVLTNSYGYDVYVFERSGQVWTQTNKLSGTTGESFGWALAIEGDTLVVGEPWDSTLGTRSGSVHVFSRASGAWVEEGKLYASNSTPDSCFGSAVALSGNTVVVGAEGYNAHFGSAYVFTKTGNGWGQEAELPSAGVYNFGCAVGVSGDTAIVGASSSLQTPVDQGATYVFARSGSVWTQQAVLQTSGPPGYFGDAVAIAGDDVIVGSWGEITYANDGAFSGGALYWFERAGASWTQQSKAWLDPDGAVLGEVAAGRFGVSVSLAPGVALAGAPDRFNGVGEAYVFELLADPDGPCASDDDCATGHCADGLCCDAACDNGLCDACSVAAGAAIDGVCSVTSCAASDECHEVGSCDPATGTCDDPAKPDGAACTEGQCEGGACQPDDAGEGGAGAAATSGASTSGGDAQAAAQPSDGCQLGLGGAGDGTAWFAAGTGLLWLLLARRRPL